jgi:restriction system protein
VLTYDPSARVYLVGTIVSDYFYDPSLIEDDPNARRVDWQGDIPRDLLSVATKNSLGAISTLFLLPGEATTEIEGHLAGKSPKEKASEVEDEDNAVDEILRDIQVKAVEFIKDKVNPIVA